MSLVAYDSSGDSEDDTSEVKSTIPAKKLINITAKRSRESVKITIPSLKEFEEDENKEAPMKKPKYKPGSGLFSILPPPKNVTTLTKPGFMPHALKSKTEKNVPSSVEKNFKPTKKPEISLTLQSEPVEQVSDEDASHETEDKFGDSVSMSGVDFFSLDSSSANIPNHSYEPFKSFLATSPPVMDHKSFSSNILDEPTKNTAASAGTEASSVKDHSIRLQKPLTDIYQSEESYVPEYSSDQYSEESTSEPNPVDALLNDEGFRKLQGKRREFEGINFIDVNAEDQLSDRKEWLMKSLTEESTHRPSRKKHNMPTQQQRRKHQITYLAFQAKERELDLKNQWALNNRTRRETQAKYGF